MMTVEWFTQALPVDASTLSLLFFAAMLAGWVDAIGGGGGLVVLPVLLWVGVSPVQALATNKLQGSFGTLTATISFARSGLLSVRQHYLAIVGTFCGSVLGVYLLQQLQTAFLAQFIPIMLILFALYFIFSPQLSEEDKQQHCGYGVFALTAALGIGFYDGFFGPGAGSFFVLACILLLGMGLKRATATTKLLNFTSNIAALGVFALSGHVLWELGLLMGVGQIIGGYLGARMAIKHGKRLIRPVLVGITLLISLKLLLN